MCHDRFNQGKWFYWEYTNFRMAVLKGLFGGWSRRHKSKDCGITIYAELRTTANLLATLPQQMPIQPLRPSEDIGPVTTWRTEHSSIYPNCALHDTGFCPSHASVFDPLNVLRLV